MLFLGDQIVSAVQEHVLGGILSLSSINPTLWEEDFINSPNCCCSHRNPPITMASWFLTSNSQFLWSFFFEAFHALCASWMIGSVKKEQDVIKKHGLSHDEACSSGFHGYQEILCSKLLLSITKRLISIKVLVQEEVREPFRSAGSCATEEQSKCVIAVIS